jgi:hypothetical protein
MTETAVDAPAATRREWIALVVLALPTLLAAMDFSVLFLALPGWRRICDPTAASCCGRRYRPTLSSC